jgi:hypothetical protein
VVPGSYAIQIIITQSWASPANVISGSEEVVYEEPKGANWKDLTMEQFEKFADAQGIYKGMVLDEKQKAIALRALWENVALASLGLAKNRSVIPIPAGNPRKKTQGGRTRCNSANDSGLHTRQIRRALLWNFLRN